MASTSGSGSTPPALCIQPSSESPSSSSITRNGAPSGGDVVVEHAHGAGMVDLVRDVALAQEPLAHVLVRGDVRVQHLDGDLLAVAVRRRVDRGHAADVDQAIDRPLVVEGLPDPLLGQRREGRRTERSSTFEDRRFTQGGQGGRDCKGSRAGPRLARSCERNAGTHHEDPVFQARREPVGQPRPHPLARARCRRRSRARGPRSAAPDRA